MIILKYQIFIILA